MGSCSNRNVLNLARKQLSKTNLETVDGVPYLRWDAPNSVAPFYRYMAQYSLRDTDVINLGFPRSGNHWLFEISEMILRNEAKFVESVFVERLLEHKDNVSSMMLAGIEELKDPRLLVSHCRISKLSNQIAEKGIKIVYIVRNPKDVLCSWYKMMLSHKIESDRFHGNWEEFFELSMTGELPWGSWFDHVLDLEAFSNAHPSVPVHIVQYEKIKTDPAAEINRLCRFLGQNHVNCNDIAKLTEFNTMKDGTKHKMAKIQKACLSEKSGGYFVKGTIGEWKKYFTVDMNQRFDKEFEKKMYQSKIGQMVKEFIMS